MPRRPQQRQAQQQARQATAGAAWQQPPEHPANAAGTAQRGASANHHMACGCSASGCSACQLSSNSRAAARRDQRPAPSCSACSPVPSNDNGTTSNVHHGMIGRLTSGPNRAVPPNRATHSGNRPRLATPRRPGSHAGPTGALRPGSRQAPQQPQHPAKAEPEAGRQHRQRRRQQHHHRGQGQPLPRTHRATSGTGQCHQPDHQRRAHRWQRRRRPRHRRLRPALHPMPPPAAVASNVPAPGTATTTSGTAVPRSPPPRPRENRKWRPDGSSPARAGVPSRHRTARGYRPAPRPARTARQDVPPA